MEKFNKNQENQTSENDVKVIFHYCDKEGKPIFKTKVQTPIRFTCCPSPN
jgi:hypothetical protein